MRKTVGGAVAVLLMSILLVLPAKAADTLQNIPYDSYTYWLGYSEKSIVPTKAMYTVETQLTGDSFGYTDFKQPKDIFCDNNGDIYIIEEGNSRLTILDKNMKLKSTITKVLDKDGQEYTFSGANGVFVDGDKLIYIADTANARVLVCDQNAVCRSVITVAGSPLIPADFVFAPVRVAVDSQGSIYVLSRGSTYGALLFAQDGSFSGFYGANKVSVGITQVFDTLWSMFFVNNEQRGGQLQKIPYQFSDLCVSKDDFVYTVTGRLDVKGTQVGQIRCLSPTGINILKVKSSVKYSSAESFNFADVGVAKQVVGSDLRTQNMCNISVDSNGFIYALDDTYGRVFVYDGECNLLSTFGGGVNAGTQKGTFTAASSMDVYGDRIFVTDYSKASVTVFHRTEYGTLVMGADTLTLSGKYENSKEQWEKVLHLDRNSQLAYRGLAKASVIEGEYDKALQYARQGLDYNTYDQAFEYVRNDWAKKNFGWLLTIAVLVLAAVIAAAVILKKKKKRLIKNEKLRVMLGSLIHPFYAMNEIKYKKKGSVLYATIALLLFYLFKVLGEIYGGFLHNIYDAKTYNALFTLVGSVGVVLLWSICSWAVSVLFEGKCSLKEVYIVACYAMIPQIINGVFFLAFSQFLLSKESGILTVVSTGMLLLSGLILCIGTMVINEFSFFKFIGTSVITALFTGVVIFVIFMVLILLQQLYSFGDTVFKEVWYR